MFFFGSLEFLVRFIIYLVLVVELDKFGCSFWGFVEIVFDGFVIDVVFVWSKFFIGVWLKRICCWIWFLVFFLFGFINVLYVWFVIFLYIWFSVLFGVWFLFTLSWGIIILLLDLIVGFVGGLIRYICCWGVFCLIMM